MSRTLGIDDALSWPLSVLVALVCLTSLAALLWELRRRPGGRARWVFVSGLVALLASTLALLRPVWVTTRVLSVGPKVLVLVDASRRLLLPEKPDTRLGRALEAAAAVRRHFVGANVEVRAFGDGNRVPLTLAQGETVPKFLRSELRAALSTWEAGDSAKAVVLISDGRFEDTPDLERWRREGRPPLHTVSVLKTYPSDASIRSVRASGAAVAHQPFTLRIEVGCAGDLGCSKIPVQVRGLSHGVPAALLASGVVNLAASADDAAEQFGVIELQVTLERAGERVVEVAIQPPSADTLPENNRRILSFAVARERLRLLHIAGRPNYDVRALRRWLKSEASVDLVAFFILRTETDDPRTMDDTELALIPFPVDELFTSHLPSFDAVILQDINAVIYGLDEHLGAIERYVRQGGGLIMVGGPSAFAAGGYAGSLLEPILPVELPRAGAPFDTTAFVPAYTLAGRQAPVLGRVLELLGTDLPEMVGSNLLGKARPGAFVLWEHPTLRVAGAPMPLLALGEASDGRVVALGVDASHKLAFGDLAAKAAGQAYGALWDGLLGWLMRDARYEALRLELRASCFAGEALAARISRVPGMAGNVQLTLEPLGVAAPSKNQRVIDMGDALTRDVELGPLGEGGYSAYLQAGSSPPSRYDFACEKGGEPWSDSRPDPALLERLAASTGGKYVSLDGIAELPTPPNEEISVERQVAAIVPAWLWTSLAALALGAHWLLRRREGFA